MRRADDIHPDEPQAYGAYVCLRAPNGCRAGTAAADVDGLAARLGLASEFEAPAEPPKATVGYLKRVGAEAADVDDDTLLDADAVVHAFAPDAATVDAFCAGLSELLPDGVESYVLRGVLRPMRYTGSAMHNYSYAHRVLQQHGSEAPNAFLLPLNKTEAWWRKDWWERHTYFLPRYDEEGRMRAQGHALAAEAGIGTLMRRTYKAETEPAPAGAYDFLNYFECADADVPAFHAVCAALRDTVRNPEWAFVREGPTWHGRRVATWGDLHA
jgi:hypothetical protein